MELLFPLAELTKKQKDQDVLSAHAAGTKDVYRCLAASEFMFTNIKKFFLLYIYSGFLDSLKKANYPLSFWHFLRFCVKDLRLYLVLTRIQKFFKEGGGVEEGGNGAELKLLGKIACILTLLKCINVPQKKLSYNVTFFVFLNSKRIATPLNPLPLPLDPPMVYEVCISSVKWND